MWRTGCLIFLFLIVAVSTFTIYWQSQFIGPMNKKLREARQTTQDLRDQLATNEVSRSNLTAEVGRMFEESKEFSSRHSLALQGIESRSQTIELQARRIESQDLAVAEYWNLQKMQGEMLCASQIETIKEEWTHLKGIAPDDLPGAKRFICPVKGKYSFDLTNATITCSHTNSAINTASVKAP